MADRRFSITVTEHALERYQEHAPCASARDLAFALLDGTRIDGEMAHALLGRTWSPLDGDAFVASADGRGIFVVSAVGLVATYFRLGCQARAILAPDPPLREDHLPQKEREAWGALYAEALSVVARRSRWRIAGPALKKRLDRLDNICARAHDLHQEANRRRNATDRVVRQAMRAATLGELKAWVVGEFPWAKADS